MAPGSRAEYFRKRRETVGQFTVSIPREKLEKLNKALKTQDKTKVQWLNEKIDEELSQKNETTGNP